MLFIPSISLFTQQKMKNKKKEKQKNILIKMFQVNYRYIIQKYISKFDCINFNFSFIYVINEQNIIHLFNQKVNIIENKPHSMKLIHKIAAPKPTKPSFLMSHALQTERKQVSSTVTQRQKIDINEVGRLSSKSYNQKKFLHQNRFASQLSKNQTHDYMTGSYHSAYNSFQQQKLSQIQNYPPKNTFPLRHQPPPTPIFQFPQDHNYHKLKQQLLQEVTYMIEQHKNQTSASLRQALIKINDNMKKQCLLQLSKQFLPLSFLDDSEKQFIDIKDHIHKLQRNILSNNFSRKQKQLTNSFSQQLKKYSLQISKVKQMIKQLQNSIKTIQLNVQKDRELQKSLTAQKKTQLAAKEQFGWRNSKRAAPRQTNEKYDKDNPYTSSQFFKDIYHNPQTNAFSKKQSQECQYEKDVTNQKQLLIQPLQTISYLQQLASYKSINTPGNKSTSLSYSIDSQTDLHKPQPSNTILSSIKSIKDIISSKYILDNQNNLMDGNGNYILDQQGHQIKLTQDQVLMIKQSNILKYKEI